MEHDDHVTDDSSAVAQAIAGRREHGRDLGQATTEYALVMLAAAMIALLVVAWATGGGGAGRIGGLFDTIIDSIISRVP